MFKRFTLTTFVLMLLLSLVILTACSQQEGDSEGNADQRQSYTFISAKPGGTWYILTTGYAKILENGTGASTRIDASTGGSQQNVQIVGNKDADFGLGNTRDSYEAFKGIGYHEGNARPNLRSVFFLSSHTTTIHLVTDADSPINSWQDINGKRINAGVAGGMQDYLVRDISRIFNLTPKIENLTTSDSVNRLKDDMIDGVVHGGGAPIASFTDLATTSEVKFISFTSAELDTLEKELSGFIRSTIPAGTYPGQDKDINTLDNPVMIITNSDVSDEAVYEFLKQLYATSDEDLKQIHNTAGPLDINDVLKCSIPLHPGAVKFYQEQGITIPQELIQ